MRPTSKKSKKTRKKKTQSPYRFKFPKATAAVTPVETSGDDPTCLTEKDVERAIGVVRYRLACKDLRTAFYVLDIYFGKPSGRAIPLEDQKPAPLVTEEDLQRLSEIYFPKPKLPIQQESYRMPEGGSQETGVSGQ